MNPRKLLDLTYLCSFKYLFQQTSNDYNIKIKVLMITNIVFLVLLAIAIGIGIGMRKSGEE